MEKIHFYINRLVPAALQGDPYQYRKARVLVIVLLFSMLIGCILSLVNVFVTTENPVPIFPAVIFGGFLLWIFKKKSNMLLIGNLLAVGWSAPLVMFIPQTGGLHSDNSLWLVVTPLIAMLFGNKRWGVFWLLILLAYTVYLYFIHDKIMTSAAQSDDELYFLISFFFLFVVIFSAVYIFEMGQLLIIKMLNHQKEQLENQKIEIAEKNDAMQAIENRLRATNSELENFAYAASHDLKEPLRMIGMYTQLLNKQLGKQLDGSNVEFMGFVIQGVSRMQVLLDDLLNYSRLGKQQADVRNVALDNVLFVVLHNLTAAMKRNDAAIVSPVLPTVRASTVEMTQLFQNLIANAIKFRQAKVAPLVRINVAESPINEYIFSVTDNGIGIPRQYQDRVFNIFERLNARDAYEGSGIGLATCKKIVQSAGGRIWLESTEGIGTTFYFTLPKSVAN